MKYFHMTSKSAVWDKMNDEQRDDWVEYLTPFLDAWWEKKLEAHVRGLAEEHFGAGNSVVIPGPKEADDG